MITVFAGHVADTTVVEEEYWAERRRHRPPAARSALLDRYCADIVRMDVAGEGLGLDEHGSPAEALRRCLESVLDKGRPFTTRSQHDKQT